MAKNAPFHPKSPVKNFHGWAKGGASHHAPPKYATGRDTVQQTRWLTHSFAGISRITTATDSHKHNARNQRAVHSIFHSIPFI